MFPVLFKFGSFEFKSFSAMFLVAVFTGWFFAKKRAAKIGLDENKFADGIFWMVIAGAIGARVLFLAQEWGYYSKHLDLVFSLKWEGLTSFGGPLFAVPAAALVARNLGTGLRNVLDVMAAPMLLGHVFGRIGCLLNGCCFGAVCPKDFPLGVHAEGPALRYPVQLGDSLMNVVALLVLLALEKRGLKPGQGLSWFLILHGATRYIYEIWRAGVSSTYLNIGGHQYPITDAQLVAAAMIVLGTVLLFIFGRQTTQIAETEAVA